MPEQTLPRVPVENWERIRADWIADVTKLADDVEAWAIKRGWWVGRESLTLTEDRIGSYEVPILRLQTPSSRLILEPIARFVMGAEGRVDLAVFPSYHDIPILLDSKGWRLRAFEDDGPRGDWSEDAFVNAAIDLADKA
ncbi:MAG TPA: hypothetical protein VMV69_17875 [Pirellulales bacterium]|nr:hypothetical protein [Pirellulales bacterium]